MSVDMIARGLSKANAIKYGTSNFVDMVFKSRDNATGLSTYTMTFMKDGVQTNYDVQFKDGKDGVATSITKIEDNIPDTSHFTIALSDNTTQVLTKASININKSFSFLTSDWTQDSVDTNKYTTNIKHDLNTKNVDCTIYNSYDKEETVGIKIVDNNNIQLENNEAFNGRVVIDCSGAISVDSIPLATKDSSGLISATDYTKLQGLSAPVKNNLSASIAPTVTDDSSKGYSIDSQWRFNNITYICKDSTKDKAIWVNSSTDITYVSSWAELVALISVEGSTYVNKYISVANANNAPSGGVTYVAGQSLTDYIVDGGSATYKILIQGSNYSAVCQPRTITNPVITSVMLVSSALPTTKGYYIFSVTPVGGLPNGININDIAYFDGVKWSCWQTYSQAVAVLVTGTATNTQVTWRKFNGTWMSTADEYVPDGKEYQTGKLWNGKAVYRMCTSGTIQTTASIVSSNITIPTNASILIVQAVAKRSDNCWFTISLNSSEVNFWVNSTGILRIGLTNATNSPNFAGAPYTAWIEYTKS